MVSDMLSSIAVRPPKRLEVWSSHWEQADAEAPPPQESEDAAGD